MEKKYTLAPASLPKSKGARLTELLTEFQKGTAPVARIEGIRDVGEANQVRTYLYKCAKRLGLDREVKVMIRGADVYLAKRVGA
jgi:hypothetical protein